METVSFWAQSLDNISPDIMMQDGAFLSSEEKDARQQLVESVSQVTTRNKGVDYGDEITIYWADSNFVLKVILPEQDVEGRKAPVICYAVKPHQIDENWIESLLSNLENYLEVIGRTLPKILRETINIALLENVSAKKKYSSQLLIFLSCLIILVISILIWLVSKK